MLALTRKTDYALVALAELAATPVSLSAREIAHRTELPLPLLRNLLKDLCAAGLLHSELGAQGGYRLGRAPRAISAIDVVEAVEGPIRLARCCGDQDHHAAPDRHPDDTACARAPACRIRASIHGLQSRVLDLLQRTSLADLALHGAGDAADHAAVRPTSGQPAPPLCQCTAHASAAPSPAEHTRRPAAPDARIEDAV
ncbi:MAG: Rrf2 family transcriptional regulator [Phycisphaeraceae bacterium]|nr:Rrf2 family transcriptional regulator [Phycisphaeraceae bacterium]